MTDKERFHAVMGFEPADRTLYWEQGFWGGTIERWYAEGMPRRSGVEGDPAWGDTVRGPASPIAPGDRFCADALEAAGLDKPTLKVPVQPWLWPLFEEEVLEDRGDQVVIRDEMGIVKLMPKARNSIPHYLSWPVSSLDDLEKIASQRLDPRTPGRFPADWPAVVDRLNSYDGVVAFGGYPCGFFGAPRFLMGEVELMVAFIERPELVRAIIDRLASLWVALYDRVLSDVRVDCIHIWEDMSYKNGPLISPQMFRELLLPAYRRVTDVAHSHGVKVVLVDTDGDCRKLIPLMMEGGVTGLYPFEAQAGMDVVQIRRDFPTLQILGGIDKKALARGSAAIDAELERQVPAMLERGGYVPMVDHQVPPDVSWESYLYYRRRLAAM
jgi:uroporphyrinogen decarboxylase